MLARALLRRPLLGAATTALPGKGVFASPSCAKFTAFPAIRAFGSGPERAHLRPSGAKLEHEDIEHYHEPDLSMVNQGPKQTIIEERGQKWVVGEPHRPVDEIYGHGGKYTWSPFWPRQRLRIYAGEKLLYKAEFLFAYIPTLIIFLLIMPAFAGMYTYDEAVYTTMVIKVVGRQWYWVYDVLSPTDDDDDE